MVGAFTLHNLVAGFVLGYLVLLFAHRDATHAGYFGKFWQVFAFLVFFIWELVLANIRVAYDVVTPRHHMRPGVVGIPLDAKTDVEITLLANLISLTPGTLSLDVSEDRKVLYIHAAYVHDREELIRSIKDGFERRLLEVLR